MSDWKTLARHNVLRPKVVIEEAERANLYLSRALALLEMETGIPQRNIFGCDHGEGKAFCHKGVTHQRVRKLLSGPYSNGVGWTQLTYKPFVVDAEKAGGAHKPRYQMRVAFKLLHDLISDYGVQGGFQRYNGSGPAAEQYGREAVELAKKWHGRLR